MLWFIECNTCLSYTPPPEKQFVNVSDIALAVFISQGCATKHWRPELKLLMKLVNVQSFQWHCSCVHPYSYLFNSFIAIDLSSIQEEHFIMRCSMVIFFKKIHTYQSKVINLLPLSLQQVFVTDWRPWTLNELLPSFWTFTWRMDLLGVSLRPSALPLTRRLLSLVGCGSLDKFSWLRLCSCWCAATCSNNNFSSPCPSMRSMSLSVFHIRSMGTASWRLSLSSKTASLSLRWLKSKRIASCEAPKQPAQGCHSFTFRDLHVFE